MAGNVVKALVTSTTVLRTDSVNAHWIAHWNARAVSIVKEPIAFEALALIRSDALAVNAIVSVFERTNRQTSRRVL